MCYKLFVFLLFILLFLLMHFAIVYIAILKGYLESFLQTSSSSSGRRTVPTVFKLFWPCTSTCRGDGGHPAQVSVGGSFNGWRLVPMTTTAKGSAASHWCIIIDLEVGQLEQFHNECFM